jgi:hypothetical protein
MSKNEKRSSVAVLDGPKLDFVYDFLYHDARRIGSFLAQFDAFGHLQQIRQTDSVTSGTVSSSAIEGEIKAIVASGKSSLDDKATKESKDTAERVYDPLWANALALLDYLTERNLIVRDLQRARIGQFTLVSGKLSILNLAMLKQFWPLPTIKKIINDSADQTVAATGNRHERRAQYHKSAAAAQVNKADLALQILSVLPHEVEATIDCSKELVWCSLREDSLVGSSSDLLLKHGLVISGVWSILGIMDALPGPPEPGVDSGTLLGNLMQQLMPVVRSFMGRPEGAFGMTPLLIFREVSG